MAQVGDLIHDQNFNVHFNGTSAGANTSISKAPRKGAVSGRKPLGDLSNSVKPTPNQSLKKKNSSKVTGASKLTLGGGSKNNAPEKLKTSGRKALTDISNASKQQVQEAPKKVIYQTKGSVVAEEHYLNSIAEEGFLHNHEECIKVQTRAIDIDEFLKIVGLNNKGFSNSLATSPAWKPASPLDLELKEMPDTYPEDPSPPWKHDTFSDLDSPPRPPKSLNPSWGNEVVNFMLIHSP